MSRIARAVAVNFPHIMSSSAVITAKRSSSPLILARNIWNYLRNMPTNGTPQFWHTA
ncbi:MAG: hypothetical protein QME51_10295 [Planctomycetota bacterium]|nr:hypothetical protein [Planctomycetota bacterium]